MEYDSYYPTYHSWTIKYLNQEDSILRWIGWVGVLFSLILAWYISQVSGNKDLTTTKGYFFFLKKSYWTGIAPQKNLIAGDTHSLLKEKSLKEQSIIVQKLSKTYGTGSNAVKELSTTFKKGSCYALLGHNGAGKTTLLNMLTGSSFPTHGDAYIFGASITTEASLIYSQISVCPQEDILWDELTASDHIILTARLK